MSAIVTWSPAGRAGNFYFMAAATWCFAKRHGLDWSPPSQTSSEFWNPIYLQNFVHPNYSPYKPEVPVMEHSFSYQDLGFDESLRYRDVNIVFHGYWQSYLYFWDLKDEMISTWNLPWEPKPDVCSVHARFGDYLTIPGKHILVDEPYLKNAIAFMRERRGFSIFKVFSDDLPLFKEKFGHIYDFDYSTNGDIMADMCEASGCGSHINSSSTFAYWIAILNRNPNKTVITQEKWFQDGWKDEYLRPVSTKDLLPPDWIKM